jgi:hypothetical protein
MISCVSAIHSPFTDLRKIDGLLAKNLLHDPLPWRELPIFAKTLKIVGFFPISKQTPKARRIRNLHPELRRVNSKLRGAVAPGRDHLNGVCVIDRQPGGEQADGQETTNALKPTGCPSAAAGPYSRAQ